ncbi:MAG: M23 family metallopeptidase [Gemmatimonadota bacterium]|nr:M23 family metallopeptidase [Gemmatimonadota bacterium]
MWKRNLTLMVIPHNRDQMRQVRASRPTVWGLGAGVLLGCLVLAVVFYALGYFVNRHHEANLLSLTSENSVLRDQVSRLQQKVQGLRKNVNDLTEMDRKFRNWVNLAEPGDEVRKMGVGGYSTGAPEWEGRVTGDIGKRLTTANTDVDQLLREAHFLESSFEHINSILSQNEIARLHTPSILPVPPESGCWISSGFGYRTNPFTGARQFHKGIDIAGRSGTKILATANGRVESVGKDRYLGWYISIDHGMDYRTLYAHLLKKPSLGVGQVVKRGQVVGRMGRSGRATAPHLHYAVTKRNGDKEHPMNPRKFIHNQKNRRHRLSRF